MNRRTALCWLFTCLASVTLLKGAMPAHAEVVSDQSFPFTLFIFVPCVGPTGEFVTFDGVRRVRIDKTTSGSGAVHFDVHTWDEGTGTDSEGTAYNFKDQEQSISNVGPDQIQGTFTLNSTLNAITPGPAANFRLHELLHITVNGNGVQTGFANELGPDCTG
jgi:hypothetical protein